MNEDGKRTFAQKRYRPRIFFIRNLKNSIFCFVHKKERKDLIYLLLQGFTERRFIGRIKTFYKPKQKIKSSFYTLCHTDLREFCVPTYSWFKDLKWFSARITFKTLLIPLNNNIPAFKSYAIKRRQIKFKKFKALPIIEIEYL